MDEEKQLSDGRRLKKTNRTRKDLGWNSEVIYEYEIVASDEQSWGGLTEGEEMDKESEAVTERWVSDGGVEGVITEDKMKSNEELWRNEELSDGRGHSVGYRSFWPGLWIVKDVVVLVVDKNVNWLVTVFKLPGVHHCCSIKVNCIMGEIMMWEHFNTFAFYCTYLLISNRASYASPLSQL